LAVRADGDGRGRERRGRELGLLPRRDHARARITAGRALRPLLVARAAEDEQAGGDAGDDATNGARNENRSHRSFHFLCLCVRCLCLCFLYLCSWITPGRSWTTRPPPIPMSTLTLGIGTAISARMPGVTTVAAGRSTTTAGAA